MTGSAKVPQASSDFWEAPEVNWPPYKEFN